MPKPKPIRRVVRLAVTILILLLLLGGWLAAFDYLVDFRNPDVPFVVTPPEVVEAMLDLAEVSEKDTVYDLGSGDGRIVIAAARRGAKGVGIEIDPDLVDESRQKVRAEGLAERVTIRRGDIFKQDLTPATVVTMFLKPDVNARLRPQIDRLRPGTRIVSHMFRIPGAKPVRQTVAKENGSGLEHNIYLWVTPVEWESE